MAVEHSTAPMMEAVENDMAKSLTTELNRAASPKEISTPLNPPITHSKIDSIKNCCKILPCRAPIAIRTPISLVRSVTDTSMMFITPMPPTTSEITAMQEISSVMLPMVLSIVCLMLSLLRVKKSSVPCRASSSSFTPFSAVCESTLSFTFTAMPLMCLLPLIWCIKVV